MQEERVSADVGPVRSAQHEGVIRGLFFLDDLISGDERYAGHETSLGVDGVARSLPWGGRRRTCAGRVPHQRSARNTVTPSTWRRCSERVRKPPVIGRGAAE